MWWSPNPIAEYVKIAEQRLSSFLHPFPRVTFSYLAEGAENSIFSDESVDYLTICEVIH